MSRIPNKPGLSVPALLQQLDRWAGEKNAFLIVLAIGLAVLNGTCFALLKLNDVSVGHHC